MLFGVHEGRESVDSGSHPIRKLRIVQATRQVDASKTLLLRDLQGARLSSQGKGTLLNQLMQVSWQNQVSWQRRWRRNLPDSTVQELNSTLSGGKKKKNTPKPSRPGESWQRGWGRNLADGAVASLLRGPQGQPDQATLQAALDVMAREVPNRKLIGKTVGQLRLQVQVPLGNREGPRLWRGAPSRGPQVPGLRVEHVQAVTCTTSAGHPPKQHFETPVKRTIPLHEKTVKLLLVHCEEQKNIKSTRPICIVLQPLPAIMCKGFQRFVQILLGYDCSTFMCARCRTSVACA